MRKRFAVGGMLAAEIGLLAWAPMAAIAPQHLAGPHTSSIVRDGYEGFTGGSWPALVEESPRTADYIVLVFRMYGIYGTVLSLLAIAIAATAFRRGERWAWWALLVGNTIAYGGAMTYDLIVNAIGPFEAFEYVGLAVVYVALAFNRPRRDRDPRPAAAPRPDSSPRSWSSSDACAS